jgi:hypothetical protein
MNSLVLTRVQRLQNAVLLPAVLHRFTTRVSFWCLLACILLLRIGLSAFRLDEQSFGFVRVALLLAKYPAIEPSSVHDSRVRVTYPNYSSLTEMMYAFWFNKKCLSIAMTGVHCHITALNLSIRTTAMSMKSKSNESHLLNILGTKSIAWIHSTFAI